MSVSKQAVEAVYPFYSTLIEVATSGMPKIIYDLTFRSLFFEAKDITDWWGFHFLYVALSSFVFCSSWHVFDLLSFLNKMLL